MREVVGDHHKESRSIVGRSSASHKPAVTSFPSSQLEASAARSCQASGGGPGTNRVQTPPTNATQPLSLDVPAGYRPSRALRPWSAFCQLRYITKRSMISANMPSPGGQISGIAGTSFKPGSGGGGRVWYPVNLPQGYHAAPQGQSSPRRPPVASRAAPGAPRGRAHARSTGYHTAPSVQDRHWLPGIERHHDTPPRHRTGRHRTAPDSRRRRSRRSATVDPDSGRRALTTSIATTTATDGWGSVRGSGPGGCRAGQRHEAWTPGAPPGRCPISQWFRERWQTGAGWRQTVAEHKIGLARRLSWSRLVSPGVWWCTYLTRFRTLVYPCYG
jgi:hypothetical protein